MTDDLEDLKRLMDAATPAPDAQRRAENLEQAQKIFARAQGSRGAMRPTVKRGLMARVTEGAKSMLNALSHRGALTATTAIAAVALVMIVPQTRDYVVNPTSWSENRRAEAPVQTTEADQEAAVDQNLLQEAPAEPAFEAPTVVEEAMPSLPRPHILNKRAATGLGATTEPMESAGLYGGTSSIAPAPIQGDLHVTPEQNTEAFANADTNPLKVTTEDPVSTFSVDVDTASYSIIRSSLMRGQLPPKDAVRVEEMVNYFPYNYPTPDGDAPFNRPLPSHQRRGIRARNWFISAFRGRFRRSKIVRR